MPFLFLLFGFGLISRAEGHLACFNTDENSDAALAKQLEKAGLWPDDVKISDKEPVHVEKFVAKRPYMAGKYVVSMHYHLSEDVISDQLNGHKELGPLLSKYSFFPYDVYCFKNKNWNTIVYKAKIDLRPIEVSFVDKNKQTAQNMLNEMSRIFQVIDDAGFVFTDAEQHIFSMSEEGNIYLEPTALASVFKKGQLSFILHTDNLDSKIIPSNSPTVLRNSKKYYRINPISRLNSLLFSFSIMKNVIKGSYRNVISILAGKIDIQTESSTFAWKKMEENIIDCFNLEKQIDASHNQIRGSSKNNKFQVSTEQRKSRLDNKKDSFSRKYKSRSRSGPKSRSPLRHDVEMLNKLTTQLSRNSIED